MKKILFVAAVACAAMTACCGSKSSVVKGSLSDDLDTLSYALGADFTLGYTTQAADVPFDWKEVEAGVTEGALTDIDAQHNMDCIERLNEFFYNKRGARAAAIRAKRAEADSIRLASGDTTKVEYPVADPEMFESEEERAEISKALGYNIGYSLQQNELPLNLAWLAQAMQDALDGNLKVDRNAGSAFLQNYMMVVRPAENKAASDAWLEKMAGKSGAQKSESGLVYKVKEMGDTSLRATDPRDKVKVHYTGRTRTGRVFDSSIFENLPEEAQLQRKKYMGEEAAKSEPIEFPLNRVIPGWTEGMMLIGKGGKITLWIPSDLAYGPRGNRGIGPNEALEFEVELVDVIPFEEPSAEEVPVEAPAAEAPAAE